MSFDILKAQSLSVFESYGLAEQGWGPFTQLPELETIHMKAKTVSHFGSLLSDPCPASQPSFPGLRNIIFEEVDFDKNQTGGVIE